jgi:hypothetical protein
MKILKKELDSILGKGGNKVLYGFNSSEDIENLPFIYIDEIRPPIESIENFDNDWEEMKKRGYVDCCSHFRISTFQFLVIDPLEDYSKFSQLIVKKAFSSEKVKSELFNKILADLYSKYYPAKPCPSCSRPINNLSFKGTCWRCGYLWPESKDNPPKVLGDDSLTVKDFRKAVQTLEKKFGVVIFKDKNDLFLRGFSGTKKISQDEDEDF